MATSAFEEAGSLVDYEDADGRRVLRRYDAAGRLVERGARDTNEQLVTLREQIRFGDALGDLTAARQRNCLGCIVRHYDEASVHGCCPTLSASARGCAPIWAPLWRRRWLADHEFRAAPARRSNGRPAEPEPFSWQRLAEGERHDRATLNAVLGHAVCR